MFTTFWETLIVKHYRDFNLNTLLLPMLFWGGGLLVWYEMSGWSLDFILDKSHYLQKLDNTQIGATLFLLILLMVISYKLVGWFQFSLIRLIEGYWPFPLSFIARYLVKRLESKLNSKKEQWNVLANNYDKLNISENKRYIELDTELGQYPSLWLLPTRFGNILRAAEEYPSDRYGLETVRVWPNLWLLIPDKTREELISSNKVIYDRVVLFFWFALFSIWTLIAFIEMHSLILWPLIISIFGALFVYYMGLIPAAFYFGDLLRASFDMHRFVLYDSLHLPLPSNPNNEREDGVRFSKYLKRGMFPDMKILFTHSETKKEFEDE